MTRAVRSQGMTWRGELAAALLSGDDDAAALVARNLGLVRAEPQLLQPGRCAEVAGPAEAIPLSDRVEGETAGDYPDKLESGCFWQPFRYQARGEMESPPSGESKWEWRNPPPMPPQSVPMAAKRVVHPRLRTGLSSLSPGRGLDMPKIIRALARAEPLCVFPRKRLRRWGRRILVVLDRSDRLVPFFTDQERLCEQLEALTPQDTITQVFATDPDEEFVFVDGAGDLATWTFGTPSRVVVLGDLGVLQKGGDRRLQQRWRRWGRRLADRGFSLVALVPFPVHVAGSDLRRVFTVVPWQRSARHYVHDELRRAELVDRLLTAASPVVRLEPGLLRTLRTSIPEALDASLESDVWQHPVVTSPHVDAATLDRSIMEKRFCPAFAALPRDRRAELLSAIRAWRFDFSNSPEVWFQEVLNLDPQSQGIVEKLFPGDLQDAIRGLHHLATQAKSRDDSRFLLRLREYGGRAADWLSRSAWEDPRIRQAVHDLWFAAPRRIRREKGGLDPALIGGQSEPVHLTLAQCGGDFRFSARQEVAGSLVAPLWVRNEWIDVASVAADKNAFWKSGQPPSWAKDWDRDKYGAWVTIEIPIDGAGTASGAPDQAAGVITQKLRWMPPGEFLMGSPESETGRWDDEGPQHEVTLTHGFWIFDTPVTQEFWLAVMGENPSHFKGDRRPVERVSWDDVQHFLGRLNERLGEAVFVLPSEAQWEYSCRAGTTTAYAFGDDPAELGNYAWYSSNSEGGTHEVAKKQANRWGLFDMHGNVREWCQDYWSRDYSEAAAVDPSGPQSGRYRVLRGGGWYSSAQSVRSAYRFHFGPGYRDDGIGFRCAQVPGAAEPTEEDGAAAEPQACPTTGGEGAALRIDAQQTVQTPIPAGRVVIVRSDVDSLELRRITRPDWATAMGRDRHGLWAEFTIDAVVQRMRWIPPGRFQMGSPENEPGRHSNEGPQHEVTLSHGYWLFDTPVTQELWLAVQKEKPSHFQDPLRPVEQVSWDNCQTFLRKINEAVAGLNLSLPTEAEWEYACRAGTAEATYAGPMEILGTCNAPILDDIAWYSGNSGVDFDLEDGWDSSGWPEKQYDHQNAGTRKVGQKLPNRWGLFDMLGNVLEWCQDYWADDYSEATAVDPTGPPEGPYRVLRGGSWNFHAQYVRSAYRTPDGPGDRDSGVGFRCAQVHPASRRRERTSEGAGESRDATPDPSE